MNKIFSAIGFCATLLGTSMAIFAAAEPGHQREEWKLQAEAVLQLGRPRLASQSPYANIGPNIIQAVAHLLKSEPSYLVNGTDEIINLLFLSKDKQVIRDPDHDEFDEKVHLIAEQLLPEKKTPIITLEGVSIKGLPHSPCYMLHTIKQIREQRHLVTINTTINWEDNFEGQPLSIMIQTFKDIPNAVHSVEGLSNWIIDDVIIHANSTIDISKKDETLLLTVSTPGLKPVKYEAKIMQMI